jgi:hypothetical protein
MLITWAAAIFVSFYFFPPLLVFFAGIVFYLNSHILHTIFIKIIPEMREDHQPLRD